MAEHFIRVGSRNTQLEIAQAQAIVKRIQKSYPSVEFQLCVVEVQNSFSAAQTLNRALLEGEIDLCVQSLRDIPVSLPEQLEIMAYSRRGNPRDALVLPQGTTSLQMGQTIGAMGTRRAIQVSALFPSHPVLPMEGTMAENMEKLDRGEYGALVLAFAVLARVHQTGRISRVFSTEEIIPPAGQGILAVRGRRGENYPFLECVDDYYSKTAALAERTFVAALEGSCPASTAAYAEIWGGQLKLTGLYAPDGVRRPAVSTLVGDAANPQDIGVSLAEKLKKEIQERD